MLHSFRQNKGVTFLERPDELLRAVPLGNVIAHNLETNPRRRKALETHVSDYHWHRRMTTGFEMRTVFAEVERPRFMRSFLSSRRNLILNGASGRRARNSLDKFLNSPEESVEYLRQTYNNPINIDSIEIRGSQTRTCWIDTKNFHNFFHFFTESFHLALSEVPAGVSVDRILFVSKSKRPAGSFVHRWIDACEELYGQGISVGILSDPPREDSILIPLSAEHLLYQFAGPHHAQIEKARPAGWSWTGYDATPHPVKIFQLNSYNKTLRECREKLVELAHRKVQKRWSRHIYAIRSPELQRQRVMRGEASLVSALGDLGFEIVDFGKMSPLEQVKCVKGAQCVVMQHGAGMTNMIFANPNAHVFELGTHQTALSRWHDFIPLSHVAGCHYHHVFLGMDFEEDKDPVFADHGLLPPVLEDDQVEEVVSLILSGMKDSRAGTLVGMIRQCEYFMSREAYNQAYRLLDQNMAFFDDEPDYWEVRGRLATACGHVGRARDCEARVEGLRSRMTGS